MTRNNYMSVLTVIFCFTSLVACELVVDGVVYDSVSTAFWNDEAQTFLVTTFQGEGYARLLDVDLFDTGYYTGAVVFVEQFISSDTIGRILKDEGAFAMVLRVEILGKGGIGLERPREAFSFPSLEISYDDFAQIKDLISDTSRNVLVNASTSPQAEELFGRYEKQAGFVNLFFGALYLFVFFVILYHIGVEIRDVGAELSLKFLIGCILLFLNLCRLFFLVGDPLTKYRAIGWKALAMFYGSHFFVSILGMAIITIYWFEVVNRGFMKMKFLHKISIPYYVIISIYFTGIVICFIVLVFDKTSAFFQWFNTMLLSVLSITMIVMAIFQLIIASIIVGRKRKLENVTRREHKSNLFASKIIAISILEIFLIPLFIMYSAAFDDFLATVFISLYWIFCAADSLLILSLIEWGTTKSRTNATENPVNASQ
eukprot:TRINITY_DN542_c0_g1_i1.p1 TRINITY_DN542_c0_g1~~TRINITY_DN542_c0_g1_i1.p1  ORF type:complete len:428 (+),score=67.17 TRINITY_DN542_c0_g1_i1:218-1501(+)